MSKAKAIAVAVSLIVGAISVSCASTRNVPGPREATLTIGSDVQAACTCSDHEIEGFICDSCSERVILGHTFCQCAYKLPTPPSPSG